MPYLNYCPLIWVSYNNANKLAEILRIRRKAVRIITNSCFSAHSLPLFHKLHLLQITDISKLQVAEFM